MPIATGLALGLGLAGLGAKTATDIYAAKKSSDASKRAAQIQQQASDKAQGIFDRTYQPYLTEGRTAASTLGRLTTPGPGAHYAAADPTQPPSPAPTMAVPRRPVRTLGGIAAGGGAPSRGDDQSQPPMGGGSPPPMSNMVMLEAPDGSGVRSVPAEMAPRLIAAGARRVQ